jgi:hypothetical protein
MGWQRMSPRKVRQLSEVAGIPFDAAWNSAGSGVLFEARGRGDRHYIVNRRTGEVEPYVPFCGFHDCTRDHSADWKLAHR